MHALPLVAAALLACTLSAAPSFTPSHQVIVATNVTMSTGALSVVETAPPWPATPLAAPASHDSVSHVANGMLYVLGRTDRTVVVRALPSLIQLQSFSIAPVLAPRDILMVTPTMALISDHDSAHLWWLDTSSGVLSVGQDLSMYADPDRLPDVAMMAMVGGQVYVQMQRYDRTNNFAEHGAMLAVLAPGFNPTPPVILNHDIALQGIRPDYRMQANKKGTKLWVSTPGVDGDWGGWVQTGIEEVDLTTWQSLGFVMTEFQSGADFGPFVMVSEDKGFVVAHTSIVASTHLRVFDRFVGQIAELHVSIAGRLDTIAFDKVRRQVVYPVPDGGTGGGVLFFDADSNAQLSPLRPVGGNPFDILVVQ